MELEFALDQIKRVRKILDNNPQSVDKLQIAIQELDNRITDQLKKRIFMFVPPMDAKYLDDCRALFGKDVENVFPEMARDIDDAGWCLGVGRGTAAVYHLMRVMEFALGHLAIN